MRYLALLLLAPWLLVLAWAYLAYPKGLPRTAGRRLFDALAVLAAAAGTAWSVMLGFEAAAVPADGAFGRSSGAIWRQVLPALYGYGVFVLLLGVALPLRQLLFRARR
ncbi:hypothetical protein [Fulvimonas soli]|jgi:hypothetical protein|uniref:Metallophosphoesterase n=1 Tax=Fulvimonas soli TaxID=155197 RepID=A0A316HZG7_9GAMM|nr:hypothetical protein [Fulvimonas soli]PWK85799.1 hypothetical protein C7456_10894 [Fulvimonas soli]TNY25742.1 hypothetical protein BV497_12755 [Fulvimonas soli]